MLLWIQIESTLFGAHNKLICRHALSGLQLDEKEKNHQIENITTLRKRSTGVSPSKRRFLKLNEGFVQ